MKKMQESAAESMARFWSAPKHLLVVDDDNLWQMYFRDRVSAYNVQVDQAILCSEARQMLNQQGYNCVVLDQMMTNGKGVDLYREIAAKHPGLQVVFLTGLPLGDIIDRVTSIGPARVYPKDKMLEQSFVDQLMAQIGANKTAQ